MKSKLKKPQYIPVTRTGRIYHIPVRPFVVGMIMLVPILIGGCSVWRLRTPEFREGPQTNSVGEVWTPI